VKMKHGQIAVHLVHGSQLVVSIIAPDLI